MTRTPASRTPLRIAALSLAAAMALSACNTIAGIGEDTQSAGEVIEDVAEDTERELND